MLRDVCPSCGARVHKAEGWRQWSARQSWPCPSCGTALRFVCRPLWVVAAAAVCIGVSAIHGSYALVALVILVAAVAGTPLFDRIRIAHEVAPGHCSACGYDLRGTDTTERKTCPECGEPIRR